MNEAETRAERIDPALTAAGWGVVEGSRVSKLAVLEAKALDRPLTEGLAQGDEIALAEEAVDRSKSLLGQTRPTGR